jgi:hypothetical protein
MISLDFLIHLSHFNIFCAGTNNHFFHFKDAPAVSSSFKLMTCKLSSHIDFISEDSTILTPPYSCLDLCIFIKKFFFVF